MMWNLAVKSGKDLAFPKAHLLSIIWYVEYRSGGIGRRIVRI
jgi:hypothetical protein